MTQSIDEETPAWDLEHPFQALALTGGGYRGLFTAKALQVMEEQIGEPLARRFDLVCGTSIGGIIACALAFEVPMAKVVAVFEERGEYIFPPRPSSSLVSKVLDAVTHYKKPKYRSEPLRAAITQLIPAEATLGDALHPLAIPAVNVTEGRPQVFKTRHMEKWVRDWKFKVVDVALATSAAPTFFELAAIGNDLYADGGLFANAPDLLALHEAEHFLEVPVSAIRMLSVGTTTQAYTVSHGAGRQFGLKEWVLEQRLFSVFISAQQQFVEQLVAHRLGDRYLRIDRLPSNEQAPDLGLDVATPVARKTLLALAEKSVTDMLGGRLLPYLGHHPQLQVLKKVSNG